MFSKKATKIDDVFTGDFINKCGLLRKHEHYSPLFNKSAAWLNNFLVWSPLLTKNCFFLHFLRQSFTISDFVIKRHLHFRAIASFKFSKGARSNFVGLMCPPLPTLVATVLCLGIQITQDDSKFSFEPSEYK